MGYDTLTKCVDDLERSGQLVRIEDEVDADLEAAEIHRRVFRSGGPAVYFARVKGCRFPMVSNLFGTMERTHYLFRDTLERVRRLIELKIEPGLAMRRPGRYLSAVRGAWSMLPRCAQVDRSPHTRPRSASCRSCARWPGDGGAFITLPVVYSEDVAQPGVNRSNLGMYRVQISGGQYRPDLEVGLHYQIHRGIGVHHAAAIARGQPLRINVFVGGAPAMTVAAVMPLPEGMSELAFAGMLGRTPHRGMIPRRRPTADLCRGRFLHRPVPSSPLGGCPRARLAIIWAITAWRTIFPCCGSSGSITATSDLAVHRGRPSAAGGHRCSAQLIHELTGPVIPQVIPGVHAVHAVDSGRGASACCWPSAASATCPTRRGSVPQELLTQAHAILGQGQMSLAKYLMIVAREEIPLLDVHDVPAFFGTCSSAWTGGGTCISRPARRSTRWTTAAAG